jgi:hypothetical protein
MESDAGAPRPDPFFIVYRRRSGSTFLSNLLCGSPEIGIAPESRFLERLWKSSREPWIRDEKQLRTTLDGVFREPRFSAWGIAPEEARDRLTPRLPLSIAELARWFIHLTCDRRFPASTIHGMKTQGDWYARRIGVLRSLFPEARVVMLVRDGRAVFASCKQARYSGSGRPFETNPWREAFAWQRVAASFARHRGEGHTLLVRYEDLVLEPRPALRAILAFLSASSSYDRLDAMLRPGNRFHYDPASAHLHPNVSLEPVRSRIDSWRQELTPEEIRAVELAAGPALTASGYALLYSQGTRHRLQRSLAVLEDGLWRGRRRLSVILGRNRRGM